MAGGEGSDFIHDYCISSKFLTKSIRSKEKDNGRSLFGMMNHQNHQKKNGFK